VGENEELQKIKLDLAGMKARLAALGSGQNSNDATITASSSHPEEEATAPQQQINNPKELQQLQQTAIKQQAEKFKGKFDEEAVDPSWGRAYEATVSTYFLERQATGNSLKSIECHETMCRATVGHENLQARSEFSEMLGSGPLTGGSFYHPAETAELASIVYMGRPGMTFRIPRSPAQ
jgi:hypothetical protein